MKKKVYSFIFCLFISLLQINALNIKLPAEVDQGDFITIYFQSKKRIKNPTVTMINMQNKEIQKIAAFPVDNKWIAIVGIGAWYEAGAWTVKAETEYKHKSQICKKILHIKEKKFDKYTLYFDKKNTSIIRNTNPEKFIQAKKLNSILEKVDPKAKPFKGPFIRPLVTERRTSPFAQIRTIKYPDGSTSSYRHWGIDFGTPIGTNLIATGSGKVVLAENRITSGISLVIEHAPGVYTIYYHLSELLVKENDFVKVGDIIAKTGNTGLSTGPHLHWEARINTVPVSPDALSSQELFK